ncbi:hypothetical protein ABL78_4385 [Leptomonas seymouri]|uniref:Uncharacterized protein n=1 Tax=Leptomonas seymouri TaxID=5684 RepID=A0A0N1PC11_LEPSE|nr:hypothetical protein ABL78_4385 [Leptomonas seymouri]|eukprot:KPI86562.1 hypothetical protein ABL78_4385 [Leptomonas seymouri]
MSTHTPPPLRPATESHRTAAASTLPPPVCGTVADYTYTQQLRVYTAVDRRFNASAVTETKIRSAIAAAADNSEEFKAKAQDHEATPAQSSGKDQAGTRHDTASVFQGKLQRALWLDRLTSCAHAESSSRAGLRCREADAREALWWPYQRAKAAIEIREDFAQRSCELREAQIRQERQFQHVPFSYLAEYDEPGARRAIELDASHSFQLLCVEESTDHMQLSARQLDVERQAAEVLQHKAQDVRALELELATQSYYAIPAFNLPLRDLALIAEGYSAKDLRDETPLEEWRRRYPTGSGAAAAAAAAKAKPAPLSAPVGQSTVTIVEMYARRYLRYEEEKERLFLDWWRGMCDISCMREVQARQQLWLISAFVASPLRMRAVMVIQRWWRMLRCSLWSQQRQKWLAVSLSALPQRHSSDRCKRQLRVLERMTAQTDGDQGSSNAEAGIAERLVALRTAATHSRRYEMELDLYTYTLLQKGRAFYSGVGIPPPSWTRATHLNGELLLAPGQWQLRLSPMCMDERRMMFFERWRQTRWRLHSTLENQGLTEAEAAELSRKDATSNEVRHERVHLDGFASGTRHGPAALKHLQAAQEAVAEAAAKACLHIRRQEAHERRVWMSSFSLPDTRLPSSVAQLAGTFEKGQPPRARDLIQPSTPGPCKSALEGSGGDAPREAGNTGTCCVTPSSSVEAAPNLARAQKYVERAIEAFHTVQHQHCDRTRVMMGEATEKPTTASASSTDAVGEAVHLYSAAFDRAAACVYAEQYTTVLKRFSTLNVGLLNAAHAVVKAAVSEKSAIVAEECTERRRLVFGQDSSRCISQYHVILAEEAERSLLAAAQVRQADIICSCCSDQKELLRFS